MNGLKLFFKVFGVFFWHVLIKNEICLYENIIAIIHWVNSVVELILFVAFVTTMFWLIYSTAFFSSTMYYERREDFFKRKNSGEYSMNWKRPTFIQKYGFAYHKLRHVSQPLKLEKISTKWSVSGKSLDFNLDNPMLTPSFVEIFSG